MISSLRCLQQNQTQIMRAFATKIVNPPKLDPGVNRRKQIAKPADEDVEDGFDMDTFESDFMQSHVSHKEHVKEMRRQHEKEKYMIVKQKYFREKFPNFLTWHDKEQIRYLHNKDPEEWSITALADGFPALPAVIKKLLKGNYKKDLTRIESHDKTVERNWAEFKEGAMKNLPLELQEHLKKFTHRKLNFKAFQIPEDDKKIVKTRQNEPGEFSEIILSYEKLKNRRKTEDEPREGFYINTDRKDCKEDMKENNVHRRNSAKLVTFSQLQHNIEKNAMKGEEIGEDDKLILKVKQQQYQHKIQEIEKNVKERSAVELNVKQNKVATLEKSSKDYSHLMYPDEIIIPKKFYRQGQTYKVNDCYYDSDGTFLYRVPGIY